MIDPREARERIDRHVAPLGRVVVRLDAALGSVLAADIRTTVPLPPFDNAAMDGFALRAEDVAGASEASPVRLDIVGSAYAGSGEVYRLGKRSCCRIATGAQVPRGGNAVLPREEARVEGRTLTVVAPVVPGRHVRCSGEDAAKGSVILRRGTLIHPGVVACLAAVGRADVPVVRKPRVSVVVTGDETIAPGHRLGAGQIYDSNSYMLHAMLGGAGIPVVRRRHVRDHPSALRSALGAALRCSDVVLVSGGVSVGDRDYLRPSLEKVGVREVFWRVRQKPGKPLYFGSKGRRVVFGLPGNPVSAFTCFYMYVYPALRRMMGLERGDLPASTVTLADPPSADASKWMFLRAAADPSSGKLGTLGKQASHMVTPLADAGHIVVVPPDGDSGEGDRERQEKARRRKYEAWRLPFAED